MPQELWPKLSPTLKSMEKQKLVQVRVEQTREKVDRQIYALTKAGEEKVHKWLAEPPPAPSPRNELVLKLFLGVSTEPSI